MNFLGHLLLTYPHRELTMGNLLGDFVRSREARRLEPGLRQGIAIHHDIDRFTDSHPDVRKLIRLMRASHGKYAPVVVDILLDYILARNWDEHASIPYPHFTEWVYDVVTEFIPVLSHPVSTHLGNMVRHRWIDGYDTEEKLHHVLLRMDIRASFPSSFISGTQDIEEHYEIFVAAFSNFYNNIREMPSLQIPLSKVEE